MRQRHQPTMIGWQMQDTKLPYIQNTLAFLGEMLKRVSPHKNRLGYRVQQVACTSPLATAKDQKIELPILDHGLLAS